MCPSFESHASDFNGHLISVNCSSESPLDQTQVTRTGPTRSLGPERSSKHLERQNGSGPGPVAASEPRTVRDRVTPSVLHPKQHAKSCHEHHVYVTLHVIKSVDELLVT